MLGERPKPAQMLRTAPRLVDAADIPAAGIDGVILTVLVDPGAEAGPAELESHGNGTHRSEGEPSYSASGCGGCQKKLFTYLQDGHSYQPKVVL